VERKAAGLKDMLVVLLVYVLLVLVQLIILPTLLIMLLLARHRQLLKQPNALDAGSTAHTSWIARPRTAAGTSGSGPVGSGSGRGGAYGIARQRFQ
jgi:hypothetical protein